MSECVGRLTRGSHFVLDGAPELTAIARMANKQPGKASS